VNKEVFKSRAYDESNPFLIGSLEYAEPLLEHH
jgi:hypothetical protein